MDTTLIRQVKLGTTNCNKMMLNNSQVWPIIESEINPPEFDIDYGPLPELTHSSALVFTTYGKTYISFESIGEVGGSTNAWYGGPRYTQNVSDPPDDLTYWSAVGFHYLSNKRKWVSDNTIIVTKDKPFFLAFDSFKPLTANMRVVATGDPFYVSGTLNQSASTVDYNFAGLFSYCTLLQTANIELSASANVDYVYASLFEGCTSLKCGPSHIGVHGYHHYDSMFYGCTSLVKAPIVGYDTTDLDEGCYNQLFYGCSSLKYIEALFLHEPSSTFTKNWVYGVSPDGTFVKNKGATWDERGPSYIPEGWTIKTIQTE